jgi:hypothetical protein
MCAKGDVLRQVVGAKESDLAGVVTRTRFATHDLTPIQDYDAGPT